MVTVKLATFAKVPFMVWKVLWNRHFEENNISRHSPFHSASFPATTGCSSGVTRHSSGEFNREFPTLAAILYMGSWDVYETLNSKTIQSDVIPFEKNFIAFHCFQPSSV